MSLNDLCKQLTADTWAELAAKMDGGYVPTLRPQAGSSRRVQRLNALRAELADRIEALGWPVYRGC